MSRIGKQKIEIPQDVNVSFSNGKFFAKGPLGSTSRIFREEIDISISDNEVTLNPRDEKDALSKALWGTYASHIYNMIHGVTKGFEKKLVIEGVGYKANIEGDSISLAVGFSHHIEVKIPEGIKVVIEKNIISISGIDKEKVGQFASKLRKLKKPEPYKGKGIRYENEIVRRKQGKKVVA